GSTLPPTSSTRRTTRRTSSPVRALAVTSRQPFTQHPGFSVALAAESPHDLVALLLHRHRLRHGEGALRVLTLDRGGERAPMGFGAWNLLQLFDHAVDALAVVRDRGRLVPVLAQRPEAHQRQDPHLSRHARHRVDPELAISNE